MATLLAYAPYSVAHWAGYEATKKVVYNTLAEKERREARQGKKDGFFSRYQLSQKNTLIVGLAALNASLMSLAVSSPFDMVRVRLQLLDSVQQKQAEQLQKGWWAMAKLIAKEEGPRGFFKGMAPKVMAAIPGGIGYLFAYEYIKKNLESDSSSSAAATAAAPTASSSASASILPPTFTST
ncbi:hypothetical protein BGZ94_006221 [Podila epigama]|nr:hypothetical protein BGZ94_006221 [Podila epigama]